MAKQLLVVDDDPSLLLAVSETLRAEGYEVVTARRGAEAMVRVAESLPNLIISDIRMPGMDGYALVRSLRSTPRTRLVPIIFLTAKDETADRIAGFRTGVDAYITKPFEPEELVAVVKSILERVLGNGPNMVSPYASSGFSARQDFKRCETGRRSS